MYLGMNADTGRSISDLDHIRQSVKDIIITPIGSRIARREYGSLLFRLIDQPQNDVTRLRMMSAIYSALTRWESRIQLTDIDVQPSFDGTMVVTFSGKRIDTDMNVNFELPIGG
ncbi:GPW/gp25 family protein [Limnobaculum xujianqingii]|uniref:GPW/gp25 family protein n=1 Tax=Limnobaculum xujianqingii TaxID=2738837 RepID=UPI0015BCE20C|nr:GPW/gp25 family protein [Limnobaculum xujianqingii]